MIGIAAASTSAVLKRAAGAGAGTAFSARASSSMRRSSSDLASPYWSCEMLPRRRSASRSANWSLKIVRLAARCSIDFRFAGRSSGQRTQARAAATIRMATMMKVVTWLPLFLGDLRQQALCFGPLGVGQRALDDRPVARAQRAHERDDGQHAEHQRAQPQQQRRRIERRLVEHEVAVAVDHEVDDLAVGLARLDLLVDLPAQVDGEFGVRLGDRLVLADEAAQLRGDVDRALRGHGVEVGRRGVGGKDRERQRQHQQGEKSLHDRRSSSIIGSIFVVQTSSLIGPICLKRITPFLSIRNVSDTPYTPYSMPTRPSRSFTDRSYGLPHWASQPIAASGLSL